MIQERQVNQNKTKIQNQSNLFSCQLIDRYVIGCFSDMKTVIYSLQDKNLNQKVIKQNELYSCFIQHEDKIYMGKAFGGIDVYQNDIITQYFYQEQNPQNFVENLIFHDDLLIIIGIQNVILIKDQQIYFQYKYENKFTFHKSSYDIQSKTIYIAFQCVDKFFFDFKLMDDFIHEIQENNLQLKTYQNNQFDCPISCMSISKGGQRLVFGLYNGSLLVYLRNKQMYKLQIDFTDNEDNEIYANMIAQFEDKIVVAWSQKRMIFYDLKKRIQVRTIKHLVDRFEFVLWNDQGDLLFYSRSNDQKESSVFSNIKQ